MPLTLQDDLEGPLADPHPFERTYRDYNLKFKPQETPEGTYQAFVIVTIDLGYVHTCGSVTPGVAPYASQLDAADAGWQAGKHWVDHLLQSEQDPRVTDASGGSPDADDPPAAARGPSRRRTGRDATGSRAEPVQISRREPAPGLRSHAARRV